MESAWSAAPPYAPSRHQHRHNQQGELLNASISMPPCHAPTTLQGELLKGQLAYEVDQSRLRAAFECLESSLRKLAATNFGLLSRLRSPPAPLLHVLEPVLLMLRLDLPSPAAPPAEPSLVCPVASWPTASVLLSEAVGLARWGSNTPPPALARIPHPHPRWTRRLSSSCTVSRSPRSTPSSSSSSTRTSPSSRMLRRTARGPKSQPKPDHNDATLAVCV